MSVLNAARLVVSTTTKKRLIKTKKTSAPASSSPDQKKLADISDCEIARKPLDEAKLFEDDSFMHMMRPKEICRDPQFCVGGYDRFDVEQGDLGNCWFLSVLGNLTANKNLFSQVVPEGQSFDSEEYIGKFHFRFWRFGEWVEVVIDDRLPIVNGKFIYARSSKPNEFWTPLLEKAYAKFRGITYEGIHSGFIRVANQDLTGGLTELYFIKKLPSDFFTILIKAQERNALITCGSKAKVEEGIGIIDNHSYSVNKVLTLSTDSGVVQLLRIRNPWGHGEWKGAWSDHSAEWTSIPDDEKENLGLIVTDDGEFWMSYEDFTTHFLEVNLCHLGSDSADPDNKLNMASIKGKWTKGMTAGGCKDIESFCCNPQYQLILTEADEGNSEDMCEVIIGLTQNAIDDEGLKVTLSIYSIDKTDTQKPLDTYFFDNRCPEAGFEKIQEYSTRCTLSPGSYVIIPYAEEPDQEQEFLLRVMSEKKVQITEYDGELAFGAVDDRVKTFPGVDAELSLDFFNFLASPDGIVDCKQIKEILDFGLTFGLGDQRFTEELCQKIITIVGEEGESSGLCFEEFKILWAWSREWHAAFSIICGKDGNNMMPRRKLRAALHAAGWNIDLQGLMMLSNKFNLTGDNINFYEFINCILELFVVYNTPNDVPDIVDDGQETPDVQNESEEKEI